jgi:6-phosphofructokinase 1
MKIGILTAGGDCPGLNAAIRGVGKTALLRYGMKVFGFRSGYTGLIRREFRELNDSDLSGLLTEGGTILGTSREKPFKKKDDPSSADKPDLIRKTYKEMGLDCLVCIGGNGTMKTADKLAELGLNIVGVPKTIDNDVNGTDITFGFDSAMTIATEAIDRLHTTANSHGRTMVVEVMGHSAGWLALYSGLAGGGDVILIPEIPYRQEVLSAALRDRAAKGKPYSIIVVAEGIDVPVPGMSAGTHIGNLIKSTTGLETRVTILGYIQRGGSPTPADRIIATELGSFALELAARGDFRTMAAYQGGKLVAVPLAEAAGKTKTVPRDLPLIDRARGMGVCFGG